jgi:hypothetical protein
MRLNELTKLEQSLGGMAGMDRLPDAVVVIDVNAETLAVKEAKRCGIPVIGLVDTNCDPDVVDYVVPGNDDAIRSCLLFLTTMQNAISDGKTLVSATGDRTPNVPGEIKFWDPETGQVRATFTGHAAPLAFSPDGQVLLVGANDHRISLWEKAGRADSDRTASVNSHDRRKTAASRD